MTIEEFIDYLNEDSKYRWELFKILTDSPIGFRYELTVMDDTKHHWHFQVQDKVINKKYAESIKKSLLESLYEKSLKRKIAMAEEKEELYQLYKGMTLSMQKAVKDIMKTMNGLEIDDEQTCN